MTFADTAAIAIGFGTIASRSTVTLSAAIHGASERLRDEGVRHRRQSPGMRAGDLELRKGGVGIVGVPGAEVIARRDGAGGASRLGPRPPARRRSRTGGDLLLTSRRR